MGFWRKLFLARPEPAREAESRDPDLGSQRAPAGSTQLSSESAKVVAQLLSVTPSVRQPALGMAKSKAASGSGEALCWLVDAIRTKARDPSLPLYEPGIAVSSAEDHVRAREELLQLAREGSICREARRAGRLISMLSSADLADSDDVLILIEQIREAGGPDQVHEFQLVGTHLQAWSALGPWREAARRRAEQSLGRFVNQVSIGNLTRKAEEWRRKAASLRATTPSSPAHLGAAAILDACSQVIVTTPEAAVAEMSNASDVSPFFLEHNLSCKCLGDCIALARRIVAVLSPDTPAGSSEDVLRLKAVVQNPLLALTS